LVIFGRDYLYDSGATTESPAQQSHQIKQDSEGKRPGILQEKSRKYGPKPCYFITNVHTRIHEAQQNHNTASRASQRGARYQHALAGHSNFF